MPFGSDGHEYAYPQVGEGVPGFTDAGWAVIRAHVTLFPSPISNVVATRRAFIVMVMPYPLTDESIEAGVSVHSHSGYPTTAMFHSFALGSGPTDGVGTGTSKRATRERTNVSTSARVGAAAEAVGAVGAALGPCSGAALHSFLSTIPFQHSGMKIDNLRFATFGLGSPCA